MHGAGLHLLPMTDKKTKEKMNRHTCTWAHACTNAHTHTHTHTHIHTTHTHTDLQTHHTRTHTLTHTHTLALMQAHHAWHGPHTKQASWRTNCCDWPTPSLDSRWRRSRRWWGHWGRTAAGSGAGPWAARWSSSRRSAALSLGTVTHTASLKSARWRRVPHLLVAELLDMNLCLNHCAVFHCCPVNCPRRILKLYCSVLYPSKESEGMLALLHIHVCVCVRVCMHACVRVCVCVCGGGVHPALAPCAVYGRSRNPFYYYHYYPLM